MGEGETNAVFCLLHRGHGKRDEASPLTTTPSTNVSYYMNSHSVHLTWPQVAWCNFLWYDYWLWIEIFKVLLSEKGYCNQKFLSKSVVFSKSKELGLLKTLLVLIYYIPTVLPYKTIYHRNFRRTFSTVKHQLVGNIKPIIKLSTLSLMTYVTKTQLEAIKILFNIFSYARKIIHSIIIIRIISYPVPDLFCFTFIIAIAYVARKLYNRAEPNSTMKSV